MTSLNIGVEATSWHNSRGYGRHARSLLGALACLDTENRYTFLVDSLDGVETMPPQVEVVLVGASRPASLAASANGRRSLNDMWRMSRALSAPQFDLLLFPTVYSYVPVFTRARKVVFMHDVIAERFPALTLPRRSARLFWKAKVAVGRRQANALVTVSEYSRQAILEQFHLQPDQVHVVGEASDPVFRRLPDATLPPQLASLERAGPLVVYVGGFGPHKNLEALVGSFARIQSLPAFHNARLVLVGEYQKEVFFSYSGAIQDQIGRLGLAEHVIFTGFLPDAALVHLLNRAAVLVLPSLMEGFGLPAVEAAACGCPVIATRNSPLPALLGEGGLYVDPTQPAELEDALRRVLGSDDLRQQMRQAGLAASRQLTWEAAARDLLAVIQKVMAE